MRPLKKPVIRRPEYTLYAEAWQGRTFVHCDVRVPWTKTVKQQLIQDWDLYRSILGGPFFAIHEKNDRKHLKFLHQFGFIYAADFAALDGVERQLFIHRE